MKVGGLPAGFTAELEASAGCFKIVETMTSEGQRAFYLQIFEDYADGHEGEEPIWTLGEFDLDSLGLIAGLCTMARNDALDLVKT